MHTPRGVLTDHIISCYNGFYSKAHKQFDGTETWKSYAFYAFKDNNSAKIVEQKKES